LTICHCGPHFCVSILFFFKEPIFLELAPKKRKKNKKLAELVLLAEDILLEEFDTL